MKPSLVDVVDDQSPPLWKFMAFVAVITVVAMLAAPWVSRFVRWFDAAYKSYGEWACGGCGW